MLTKTWRYIFHGPKNVKFNFFNRMWIGFKFILLVICAILTFTLVLAPATIPIGMILFRSLTYKEHFVGIKNILLGLLFIILVCSVGGSMLAYFE